MIEQDKKKEKWTDFNSFILMLSIMNGKLDEIVNLLAEIERRTKKESISVEQDNKQS